MSTALAERPAATEAFSRDQVDLIKRTIAKGASDDELKLFMAQCERTGLDPFDRQIYFIKRKQKDKVTGQWVEVGQTQTSIDGFRVVAERTGEMDGQDVAWCDETGAWTDVWLKKTPPFAARVISYRKGCTRGFPAVARFDEYVQTDRDGKPTGMWHKMGANQIAKCAEALALRKAFPKQLSGLYTRDEMGQADNVPPPAYTVTAPPVPPQMPTTKPTAALGVGDEPASSAREDEGELPEGTVRIAKVEMRPTSNKNITKYIVVLTDGRELSTIREQMGTLAEALCQEGALATIETKDSKWGVDLTALHRYAPKVPVSDTDICAGCGELVTHCECAF